MVPRVAAGVCEDPSPRASIRRGLPHAAMIRGLRHGAGWLIKQPADKSDFIYFLARNISDTGIS